MNHEPRNLRDVYKRQALLVEGVGMVLVEEGGVRAILSSNGGSSLIKGLWIDREMGRGPGFDGLLRSEGRQRREDEEIEGSRNEGPEPNLSHGNP